MKIGRISKKLAKIIVNYLVSSIYYHIYSETTDCFQFYSRFSDQNIQ
jgi:hypothetical protein